MRGRQSFATVGCVIFGFIAKERTSVAFIEAPADSVYFSAEEDVAHYSELFERLQDVALSPSESVEHLPARLGTPMEPDNLDRSWRQLRAAADLDWLRLHDLRHACATFLLVSGASARTVMKVLGHSQIGLTMNTYAHVLPRDRAGGRR